MKRFVYFAAVLPLLLASCDKEKLIETTDNTPVPLSIDASIGITSEIMSRSLVTGPSFGNGSDIGIFITGTGYTPKVTTYTTANGTDWSLKVTDPVQSPIYLTKNEATVYGFYPVTEPSSSNSAITADTGAMTIPVTIASNYNGFTVPENQADYLYATDGTNATTMETVSKTSSNATLKFYHALSQLSFIVNKTENFGGKGILTSLSVTAASSNITGTGTLKLDGTGITLSGSPSKLITLTGSTTINDYSATPSTNVIATALVTPLTTSQSVTLTMTIDGQNYTGTISNATWESGKKYTYTVTVGGGVLNISAVSIQDWENGGSGTVEVN